MELVTIIIIAIGLAMDAFAVAMASGAAYKKMQIRHTLRIAIFFGVFQAFMPLIGYFAGQSSLKYIQNYDHWISFAILAVIGGKMIYEAFQLEKTTKNPARFDILLTLSVATSIDALAVGFTLSLFSMPILVDVAIIGIVTFVMSLFGIMLGKKAGHLFDNKIEIVGGIILIGIGLKILLEHLAAK